MGKVVPDFSAPAPPQQGGQSQTGTAAARFPGGGCPQQSHGAAGRLFSLFMGSAARDGRPERRLTPPLRISGSSGPPLPRSSPFSFPSAHRQNRSRISVTASRRGRTPRPPLRWCPSGRTSPGAPPDACCRGTCKNRAPAQAAMLRRQASPARSPPGFLREKYTAGMPQAVRPSSRLPKFIHPYPTSFVLSVSWRFCPPIGLPQRGGPFLRGPFFSPQGSNSLIGPCAPPSGLCVGAGPAPPSHWTGPAEGAPSGQPASSNSTRITSPSRNWSTMTSSRPLFSRPAPM